MFSFFCNIEWLISFMTQKVATNNFSLFCFQTKINSINLKKQNDEVIGCVTYSVTKSYI